MKALVFFFLAIFVFAMGAGAKEPAKTTARKDRANLPITVKSNHLSTDNKGKVAVFTGKVVARHGDITIYSEKLTVNYSDLNDGEVEKVEADTDVRIVQENRVGTGQHAVYQNREGFIVLTGNPRVMQGADTITGKTIKYYIDEERSVVTSGADSRVEAVIHPHSRNKNEAPR